MTLDDEAVSWKAHEALERGVNPSLLDGEPKAVALVAEWIGEHALFLSPGACMALASKIVTNRAVFAAWFRDIEPARVEKQLRQQRRGELDDRDAILERAAWHKNGYREAIEHLRAMGVHPADFEGPDERGQEEDAEREAVERAIENAPSVRLEAS